MLDQCDDLLGPTCHVLYGQVVTIQPQKMPHSFQSCALIRLLERMRSRNPGHQNDGEYNNVLFAKTKEVSRTC